MTTVNRESSDKNNFDVAHKIAMMAMEIEDWDKTIHILEDILKNDYWEKQTDLKQLWEEFMLV